MIPFHIDPTTYLPEDTTIPISLFLFDLKLVVVRGRGVTWMFQFSFVTRIWPLLPFLGLVFSETQIVTVSIAYSLTPLSNYDIS